MVAADQLWTAPPGSIPTLDVPSLDGVRSAHLIGIGGAGMRNLARLLAQRGVAVQGSDVRRSPATEELEAFGIRVAVGHDERHIAGLDGAPVDVVVISSAIGPDNAELRGAQTQGIAIWRRQQAVAAVGADRRRVAVSGTHGKTTTTSLLAVVLERAGLEPTYLIGGDLNETGGGARAGEGDLFLYEADESDGSFLLGSRWIGVVTNVDVDHVDFFTGGLPEIEAAFGRFAAESEHVVAWGDDPAVRRALSLGGVRAVTYGIEPGADIRLTVEQLGAGEARGRVAIDGAELPLALRMDGVHNLLNATAAIGAASIAGVDPAEAVASIATFDGVHRRFEHRGTARGAEFYDDYGHTPAELAVTVGTARRRGPRRLIALVQPHRYTRVQALWRELGASVAGADLVVVTDIYGASQPPIPGVTGRLVADGVRLARDTETLYLPHRADVVSYLADAVEPGDLVVTMGCGDVWMLGDAVRERIAELDT